MGTNKNNIFKQSRTIQTIWLLTLAALSTTFLAFGWHEWPGLHWDGSLLATPILNVAQGEGWKFESYSHFLLTRSTQEYNWHGVLHVLFFGSLLKAQSIELLFKFYGLVNALTFVVYAFLFNKVLAKSSNPARPIVSLLLGVYAAVIALSLQGRPEQLVPLILGLASGAMLSHTSPTIRIGIAGLTTGLIFITSPLPGILAGAGFSAFQALTADPEKKNIRHQTKTLFIILIIALTTSLVAVQLLTPFRAVAWLKEMLGTGSHSQSFLRSFFSPRAVLGLTTFAPLWSIGWFSLSLVIAAFLIHKQAWIILAAWSLSTAIALDKGADYTYVGLLPAGFLAVLQILSESKTSPNRSQKLACTLCATIFICASILSGFGLLSATAHISLGDSASFSRKASKSLILDVLKSNNNPSTSGKIAIGYPALHSPSFVVFNDEPRIRAIATRLPTRTPNTADGIVDMLENMRGIRLSHYLLPRLIAEQDNEPPREIYLGNVRFSLLANNRQGTGNQMSWLYKLSIWNPKGYQALLYQRKSKNALRNSTKNSGQ